MYPSAIRDVISTLTEILVSTHTNGKSNYGPVQAALNLLDSVRGNTLVLRHQLLHAHADVDPFILCNSFCCPIYRCISLCVHYDRNDPSSENADISVRFVLSF